MNRLTIRRRTTGAVAMLLAFPLLGCDYVNLLSGQQPCSSWTAEQSTDNFYHATAIKWATSFFASFYPAYCGKRQCIKLYFPQDDDKLLGSMNAYCVQHPGATTMAAATWVMEDATKPSSSVKPSGS